MEVLVTLGIGAAGGIIALVLEQIYLHLKDKRIRERQRLISFAHSERIINDSIFTHLRHGASIELMKSTLGMPNRIVKYDSPVFENALGCRGRRAGERIKRQR